MIFATYIKFYINRELREELLISILKRQGYFLINKEKLVRLFQSIAQMHID